VGKDTVPECCSISDNFGTLNNGYNPEADSTRKEIILRATIPSLKNLHWLWLWQGTSSPSDYHLFTALNKTLGGHTFTDDRDVQTGVT